jgi:DnaJ-class molecular chaperone
MNFKLNSQSQFLRVKLHTDKNPMQQVAEKKAEELQKALEKLAFRAKKVAHG